MRFPWQRRRDEADAALDEELRAHFAMAVADRIARGESPDDALAAARRDFGNVAHVKEVTREAWGGLWLERLLQDLRYALRALRRSPGFAVVAVLTLALGIGVNSAMFAVMHGVLLRALPYPSPDRLFVISYQQPVETNNTIRGLADAHYLALEKDPRTRTVFSHVATFAQTHVILRGAGEPKRLAATEVTSDFFALLGTSPARGRVFSAAEAIPQDGVVISDRLWRTVFNADASIVGRTIDVDNTPRTVIGVMPPSFDMPAHAELWTPLTLRIIPNQVRLRPALTRPAGGVPLERALAAWRTIASGLPTLDDEAPGKVAELIPLKKYVVGDADRPLLIFSGAVAFVLLIACANVANLLLMRVSAREREMALRAALGAGRTRLIRQLLTETLVIATIGSVLGIAVAFVTMKLLVLIAPGEMLPRVDGVHLDGAVLAFTAALVAGTTIVCGLVPALHGTEDRLRDALVEGARTMTSHRSRMRSMLVVSEIALALVLLVGAGLMLRSFNRMQRVDLGFSPAHVLTMPVDLPSDRYPKAADIRRYHDGVVQQLAQLPGANAVGAMNWLPFTHMMISGPFEIEGGATPPGRTADQLVATPNYFRAAGQRLLDGRDFTAGDRLDAPRVVIVSTSVARKVAPDGRAVGRRIALGENPTVQDWVTIVGVVDDVISSSVTDERDPAIYSPLAQIDFPFAISSMKYVVRFDGDAMAAAPAMRRIVRAADPTLPLQPVRELRDLVQDSMLTPRFQSQLLVAFSSLALVLAVVGIYGVLAYGVAQRLREIGVRVALGAEPRAVRMMIVKRTAVLVVPGLVIGVAGSIALTRVLSQFLFQISPTDPPTFIGVGVLIAIVAFGAAYLPAKRASEVDPVVVLRQ